ncbi:MAG: hypothetical protein ABIR58_00600 [Gemmatimonadaceae bacterium]
MFGCFRSIGCLIVLIALAVLGWFNRDQLRGLYSRFSNDAQPAETTMVRDGGWQPLSDAGAERGRRAVESLSRRSGPVFANLTPSEAASYIFLAATKQLPESAKDISASVIDEKLFVRANVALADFGGGRTLGPLAAVLGDRDTIQLGGTINVIRPGLGEFVIEDVKIGKFPIPSAIIPRLVGQIRKAERPPEVASNALPMKLPQYIGDVRISKGRITVYKNTP